MNVARMDAHGGWVASSLDLIRFMRTVDGFPVPADVVSSAAYANMTKGSTANAGYASGWCVMRAGLRHGAVLC